MSGATNGHELRHEDIPERVRDAFWSKVKKSRRCWKWTRATNPSGYGIMGWKGDNGFELHTAHRVAYVLAVGDIPAARVVRMTCKNHSCVRPDHLELTDHTGNVRASLQTQTRFGMNMAIAAEIRQRLLAGESDAELAKDYRMRKRRVQLIRLNKIWTDPQYRPFQRPGPCRKLTEEIVADARVRYRAGEPVHVLAGEHSVAYTTMLEAVRGNTWAHVN